MLTKIAMELYSGNKYYKLFHGNMLDLGDVIESCSIDSIVTDPPYELNFMGKGWDNSGIAFQPDTWKRCLEALKPGGYLLAFGGSRTYHRIACAIEDAGFEIRDCIMWLYGSGFPKSMALDKSIEGKLTTGSANKTEFKKLEGTKEESGKRGISKMSKEQGFRDTDYTADKHLRTVEVKHTTELAKQYKGWGTCLKPSYEPIIVARKPLEGSCTDNVIKYGVGGINIDECRVDTITEEDLKGWRKEGSEIPSGWMMRGTNHPKPNNLGRFPANTILTYGDDDREEVCGGFPNTKTGGSPTGKNNGKYSDNGMFKNGNKTISNVNWAGDSGSASRYFYCAKASKRDRDEGLNKEGEKVNDGRNTPIDNPFQGGETLRKNTHPTVKPCDLMQYLVRLVTPNGGTVLDPFNGSGSTGKAVMYENKDRNKNYKYIGIELTEEYLPIAKARIEYILSTGGELKEMPLF